MHYELENLNSRTFKMSEKLYYPGFRRYLNSQLVDLNYLTDQKVMLNPWFFTLSFFICLSHFIKLIIQLTLKEVNSLSYFIGDITLVTGPSKKKLTSIYLGWYYACFMCTFNLLRSQYTLSLQKWTQIGLIFENLDDDQIHPYSGLPTSYHRHFIWVNLFNFYGASIGSLLLCLPSFFIYPKQFMINLSIWCIITMGAGLTIVGNAANFGLLYAFQIYLYGKQMTDEKNNLIYRLESEENFSKYKLTSIVRQSTQSSTIKMKQILEGYSFWSAHNQAFFIAAFNAHSVILYLIFFVDIPGFLRIALIIIGFISWFCGLSIHFFLGAYGQRKIQKHCTGLRRVLYYNLSDQMKLQLVNYLEHIENRHFFCIFGALKYSIHHFILVILENTANLLLLIATVRRNSFQ